MLKVKIYVKHAGKQKPVKEEHETVINAIKKDGLVGIFNWITNYFKPDMQELSLQVRTKESGVWYVIRLRRKKDGFTHLTGKMFKGLL